MTTRHARITDRIDDDYGQHTTVMLDGLNCSVSEFLDWFLAVELANERYDLIANNDDDLVDVGGSIHCLDVGQVLSVNADDYAAALIELRIAQAHRELDALVLQKTHSLGLVEPRQ